MAEHTKSHVEAAIKAEKEGLKAKQELNKYQSIPRSSTGETQNIGNAPTPEPLEPTINEPGYVVFQNPEPKPEGAPAA